MNDRDLIQRLQGRGLLPHQAEFVQIVLSPSSTRVQLLKSPVGSGKTYAVIGAIVEGMETGLLRRVLIVAPRAIGAQMRSRIQAANPALASELIDKATYLARESTTANQADIWPEEGVFITSVDFAKQKRFMDSFVCSKWDLVYFDEAHQANPGTARGELLTQLLKSDSKRIVLSTYTGIDCLAELLTETFSKETTVTTWAPNSLKSWTGASLSKPEITWESIFCDMNASEASFYEKLDDAARSIDAITGAKSLVYQSLMNRAMSCLFTVESALMDQRKRLQSRNNDVIHTRTSTHQQLVLFENDVDEEPQSDSIDKPNENDQHSAEKHEALERLIEELLMQLDDLESDTKTEQFVSLIESLGNVSVCVLSQYDATITHLASRLHEVNGREPIVLSGSVASEEIQSRLHDVGSRRDIIVLATDAAIKGVELNPDVVIHYDLPSSFQQMYARFARVLRIGRSGVVRMIGFAERNAVTSSMWNNLLRVANKMSDEGWG